MFLFNASSIQIRLKGKRSPKIEEVCTPNVHGERFYWSHRRRGAILMKVLIELLLAPMVQ